MVVLDDVKVTEKELEIIRNLVENHKYHIIRKGVVIFRNIYTGEITIENQVIYFEDNCVRFSRCQDEELLWWYERFDWELNGTDDKKMAEEVVKGIRKTARVI